MAKQRGAHQALRAAARARGGGGDPRRAQKEVRPAARASGRVDHQNKKKIEK